MPYENDPAGSATDEVRFLLGDTNADAPLLTDEEVEYLLAQYVEPIRAAYQGAMALAAKYAGTADIAIGTARRSYQSQSDKFLAVAKTLADRGGALGATTALVGPPRGFGMASEENPRVMDVEWRSEAETPTLAAEGS